MIDHLGFYTGHDLAERCAFYEAILRPLGVRLLGRGIEKDGSGRVVFGTEPRSPFLVIAKGMPGHWRPDQSPGASAIHLALMAPSKAAVEEFHAIGLKYGALNNGEPGMRDRGWYAAYLIDRDSNGIEAGIYL